MSSIVENHRKRIIPVDLMAQRKIALVFIATGSLFTALASTLGVLAIFSHSFGRVIISSRAFSVHPYLQIFGFLAEFIFGVAYSLLPSFKSLGLPSYKLAYLSFALITSANLGFVISIWVLAPGYVSSGLIYASTSLELAASLIFLFEISYLLEFGRKSDRNGDGYILLSAISFTASAVSVLFNLISGNNPFGFGNIYLMLIGFVGSMIFGITMKTASLRLTEVWGQLYPYALVAQSAAIVSAFLYAYFPGKLFSEVVFSAFLVSASLYILSSRTLSQSRLLLPYSSRKDAHLGKTMGHQNLLYLELSLMSASGWLIVGILLSSLYAITGMHWLDIAFIHSLSIGFIGSTIIGIAPVLLPGILSRRTPSGKNTFLPLYLLNVGLMIFVGGDIVSSRLAHLPYWTGIGGLTIVLSMVVFMYEIHEKLLTRTEKHTGKDGFTDGW